MTMWSFQLYPSATNVWQVKVFKLGAPARHTVELLPLHHRPRHHRRHHRHRRYRRRPGFFDTEPGMNRMSAVVRGNGVTVNSITFVGPDSSS